MLSQILEMVAEWLIQERKHKKISQNELAKMTGLHESVIQRYEREKYKTCSLKRLIMIAKILETY